MRGFAIAASLALVLSAAPVFAQAPAQAKPARAARRAAARAAPRRRPRRSRPRRSRRARRSAWSTSSEIASSRSRARRRRRRSRRSSRRSRPRPPTGRSSSRPTSRSCRRAAAMMNEAARGQLEKEIERAAGRRPALPAGRAGRGQRTAAAAAGRVPEEAVPDPQGARPGEGAARALQHGRRRRHLVGSGHRPDDGSASRSSTRPCDQARAAPPKLASGPADPSRP